MKFPTLFWLCLLFTAITLRAGQVDATFIAAMKLPDAPNYRWITAVEDDARSYTIDGKTERQDDYSLVNMPLVASARRGVARGGRGNTDNEVTAIFKGDVRVVVEVDEKWLTVEELNKVRPRGNSGRRGAGMGGIGGRPGGRGRDTSASAYSNLQLSISRPHEEVAIIVANSIDLKAESDGVSGALSDTGARLLLVHSGQDEITPLRATGTFRLWIKDGALVKYEVNLEGTLSVVSSGNRREFDVHQKATTTISDVGGTKFDVPAEAKRKLVG